MILIDKDILALAKDVDMIFPLPTAKAKCKGVSYGLDPHGFSFRVECSYVVPPRGTILVKSFERFSIPKNITGNLWLKSTYIRKGLLTSFGVVDAGFNGHLNFSIFNPTDKEVIIEKSGIAQIQFHYNESIPDQLYDGYYQEAIIPKPNDTVLGDWC